MTNLFLDFLFPRKCLGCGRTGSYFCSICLNLVLLKDEPICPECGRLSVGGLTHPGCRKAWGLDGLTSIFTYKGIMEKGIKKLKYRFITDIAADLVELFLSFCGENKAFVNFCQNQPVLISVPLYPQRERWRGFNQAQLLGQMIAKNLGLKLAPDLLRRVKQTQPQVDLTKTQRRRNIANAFKISQHLNYSLPTSVLLFDDVWTSGVTLREAGKILKRSGVGKVWGLTLAR